MTRAEFERHVSDALATIPKRFRDAMRNIAIVVEDEPTRRRFSGRWKSSRQTRSLASTRASR